VKNRVIFALTGLLSALPLQADPKPLWELGIGTVMLHRPDYLGANEESFYLLPFPSIVYRGDFIKADDDGIQGLFFSNERLELDISGGGSLPVNSTRNRLLNTTRIVRITFMLVRVPRFAI